MAGYEDWRLHRNVPYLFKQPDMVRKWLFFLRSRDLWAPMGYEFRYYPLRLQRQDNKLRCTMDARHLYNELCARRRGFFRSIHLSLTHWSFEDGRQFHIIL